MNELMIILSGADGLAAAWFVFAWLFYGWLLERSPFGRHSLNFHMDGFRHRWMERMIERENRVVDTTLMASLQNGTAFFASTSLIAIGGTLSLLQSSDAALAVFATLPFGIETSRSVWEVKIIGLAVIFAYAFFKFSWAYRLMNYSAILLGATPVAPHHDVPEAEQMAARASRMNTVAGRHFNRGQRAFFFAVGYLGWFVSPYVFMAATTSVLLVMARRQFSSDSRSALDPQ